MKKCRIGEASPARDVTLFGRALRPCRDRWRRLVAGSAAILGHSSFGVSNSALTRSISAARASGVGSAIMTPTIAILRKVKKTVSARLSPAMPLILRAT